jgi:uncharacterized protein (TIGR03435 family)
MTEFARTLGSSDRQVIDKTGIAGKFDFQIEYSASETPGPDDAAPSIFTALGQLGLKLEATKAPREFLVIDHIERPTEN